MKLENIGFYTLSEQRAKNASHRTPLWRGELLLGARCNFSCPYCRHVGGKDLDYSVACHILDCWIAEGLRNVRFSGGEPTLYPYLTDLVTRVVESGVVCRVALSTNGSAPWTQYKELIDAGVNDFSVSLDACCAEDGDRMAGGVKGAWDTVVDNIWRLAEKAYTTVGIVLTPGNETRTAEIVKFAHGLGVWDIRVIPAAQNGTQLRPFDVPKEILATNPILRYRVTNLQDHRSVRGIPDWAPSHCPLVLDDVAAMDDQHYPCIIYMREGGKPIGKIDATMREQRRAWYEQHDTRKDPICQKNCLDVCVDYNTRWCAYHNNRITVGRKTNDSQARPSRQSD